MATSKGVRPRQAKRDTAMRKFIISAFIATALTAIVAGSAYFSIHTSHDGRPLRPGHAALLVS
jgi:hypothetical protein